LLGFDLLDDPDDGVTIRFHWQAVEPMPSDIRLWPLLYDDSGQLLSDPSRVPMVTTVWYPPDAWPPGDIVATETLPQLLPRAFHLGLAVGQGSDSFTIPAQRLPVDASTANVRLHPGRWVQLASFKRQGPFLIQQPPAPTLTPFNPTEAGFGESIQLTGYRLDTSTVRPGQSLPLLLRWQAQQTPQTDYTVFVHLLAAGGRRVAQSDAFPTWLAAQPTSQWPPQQPVLDRHTLALPADLSPGAYTLHVGLYNAQTLERLPLPNGQTTLPLAHIQVE
jgi:hypothetical protein